jgi:hypothetical protein
VVCERCGSIDIVRSRSRSVLDRIVRLISGRKPFRCRRCGWTARRNWDENNRPEWTKPAKPTEPGDRILEFDLDQFD